MIKYNLTNRSCPEHLKLNIAANTKRKRNQRNKKNKVIRSAHLLMVHQIFQMDFLVSYYDEILIPSSTICGRYPERTICSGCIYKSLKKNSVAFVSSAVPSSDVEYGKYYDTVESKRMKFYPLLMEHPSSYQNISQTKIYVRPS